MEGSNRVMWLNGYFTEIEGNLKAQKWAVYTVPTIKFEGKYKIDEYSQRMIDVLVRQERAATSELAATAFGEATDNARRKVRYRVDEHLLPASLVSEEDTDYDERVFAVTETGLDFVSRHADAIRESGSLERIDETAQNALETAELVDSRIDSVSGTVGSIKRNISGIDEEIDEVRETVYKLDSEVYEVKKATKRHDKLPARIDQNDDRVSGLESDLADAHERIDDVEEQISQIKNGILNVHDAQQQLEKTIERESQQHESSIAQLRERVDELEDRGLLDTIS